MCVLKSNTIYKKKKGQNNCNLTVLLIPYGQISITELYYQFERC